MALKITTDEKGIMVFRDDKGQYPSYYYSISRKNDKDEWESCYRPIRFKKGVEVENKTIISIESAFESFNISKEGKKFPYLMVTEFSIMGLPTPEITIPDTDEDAVPFD